MWRAQGVIMTGNMTKVSSEAIQLVYSMLCKQADKVIHTHSKEPRSPPSTDRSQSAVA